MRLSEWHNEDDREQFALYRTASDAMNSIQKQQKFLELMASENFATLVSAKRNLYSGTVFGFSTFPEIVSDAQSWLERVSKKEVRKNAKDKQHSSYDMLIASLQNATGIEVKEITSIRMFGYDGYNYEIRFVDKEHGLRLELKVPDVRNRRFHTGLSAASECIKKGMCSSLLNDLDLRLFFIAHEDDGFVKLESICDFPGTTDTVEEFKEYLDQFAKKKEEADGQR